MVEYNTIILGSGISGMSCAIYLRRAGISTLMIEEDVPGGQLNKISVVENYPGYPSVSGVDLAVSIFEQMNQYDIDMEYGKVIKIDYDQKIVYMDEGEYHYQYLVFATGRRENTLGLEHENEFIGHGISFCATCDGALYKGQDVVVVGGGNSAVSEAIYLSNICRKVYLVYRRDNLRAENILQEKLQKIKNIEIFSQSKVSSYLIDDGNLSGIQLDDERTIKASCVFLAVGQIPNSGLFDGEKSEQYIVVDENFATSKRDVYACGDVIKKDVYQLITASSEGVIVANSIIKKTQNK